VRRDNKHLGVVADREVNLVPEDRVDRPVSRLKQVVSRSGQPVAPDTVPRLDRGRLVASEGGLKGASESQSEIIAPRSGDELDVDRETLR
jgi:hypothetical protein